MLQKIFITGIAIIVALGSALLYVAFILFALIVQLSRGIKKR